MGRFSRDFLCGDLRRVSVDAGNDGFEGNSLTSFVAYTRAHRLFWSTAPGSWKLESQIAAAQGVATGQPFAWRGRRSSHVAVRGLASGRLRADRYRQRVSRSDVPDCALIRFDVAGIAYCCSHQAPPIEQNTDPQLVSNPAAVSRVGHAGLDQSQPCNTVRLFLKIESEIIHVVPALSRDDETLFPGRFIRIPALGLEFLRQRIDRAIVVLGIAFLVGAGLLGQIEFRA